MSSGGGTSHWVGHITGPVGGNAIFKNQEEQRRIDIMKKVRSGELDINEALKMAEDQGLYRERSVSTVLHNFHIYLCAQGKLTSHRLILQFDFELKAIKTIQQARTNKLCTFSEIYAYEIEEDNRVSIQYDGGKTNFEFEADMNDKSQIVRLLKNIVCYNDEVIEGEYDKVSDADLAASMVAPSKVDVNVLKEGYLEKKGHNAAFLSWPKRYVRVLKGELYYAKPDERDVPQNVIDLVEKCVSFRKVDFNGFSVTNLINGRSYNFRACPSTTGKRSSPDIEQERDEWYKALELAMTQEASFKRAYTMKDRKSSTAAAVGNLIRKSLKKKSEQEVNCNTSQVNENNGTIEVESSSLEIGRSLSRKQSKESKIASLKRSWSFGVTKKEVTPEPQPEPMPEVEEEPHIDLPPLMLGNKNDNGIVLSLQEELERLTELVSGSGMSSTDIMLSRLQVIAAELEYRINKEKTKNTSDSLPVQNGIEGNVSSENNGQLNLPTVSGEGETAGRGNEENQILIRVEASGGTDDHGSPLREVPAGTDDQGSPQPEVPAGTDDQGSPQPEVPAGTDDQGSPLCEASGGTDDRGSPLREASGGTDDRGSPLRETSGGTDDQGSPLREASGGTDDQGSPLREASGGTDDQGSPLREVPAGTDDHCSLREASGGLDDRGLPLPEASEETDSNSTPLREMSADPSMPPSEGSLRSSHEPSPFLAPPTENDNEDLINSCEFSTPPELITAEPVREPSIEGNVLANALTQHRLSSEDTPATETEASSSLSPSESFVSQTTHVVPDVPPPPPLPGASDVPPPPSLPGASDVPPPPPLPGASDVPPPLPGASDVPLHPPLPGASDVPLHPPLPGASDVPPPPPLPGASDVPPPPPLPGASDVPPPPPLPGASDVPPPLPGASDVPPPPPLPGASDVPPPPPLPGASDVPPPPPLPGASDVPPPPPLPGASDVPPPPPLPGVPGVPLPPPPPGMHSQHGGTAGSLANKLSARWSKKPNAKLKPFHWKKINNLVLPKTVWADMNNVTQKLDLKHLESTFKSNDAPADVKQPVRQVTSKIDPTRSKNIGIFLRAGHFETSNIVSFLNNFSENSDEAFDVEMILNLKRFQPTDYERELFKTYKGKVKDLSEADQFIVEMIKIPLLPRRLEILLAMQVFPSDFEALLPTLKLASQACLELLESTMFVSVLEYILAAGNYLNAGTQRGKANGFQLFSLPKVIDVRGKSRNETLLHYVMLQIEKNDPQLLSLFEELSTCACSAEISIKGIVAEFDVLAKELEKIQRNAAAVVSQPNIPNDLKRKLSATVEAFVEKYKKELSTTVEQSREVEQTYYQVLEKFGEPIETDSEELFSVLSQFIKDFLKVRKELFPMWKPHRSGTFVDTLDTADGTQLVENGSSHRSSVSNQHKETLNRDVINSLKAVQTQKTAPNNLPTMESMKPSKVLQRPRNAKIEGSYELCKVSDKGKKKWAKRFIELDMSQLHVYKSSGGKYLASIILSGARVTREADSKVLIVQNASETWHVKCTTHNEMEVLQAALNERRTGRT